MLLQKKEYYVIVVDTYYVDFANNLTPSFLLADKFDNLEEVYKVLNKLVEKDSYCEYKVKKMIEEINIYDC